MSAMERGKPVLLRRRRTADSSEAGIVDMRLLLFTTAKPGVMVMWTVLLLSILMYVLIEGKIDNYGVLALLLVSYLATMIGNYYFNFEEYHPVAFFFLMCATLGLVYGLVYFTGNRQSLLGFLFFVVPIYAAHYYSYLGTALMALLTSAVWAMPFIYNIRIEPLQILSLSLAVISVFLVSFITCYIVEHEHLFARESEKSRRLLEVTRDHEREVSMIYDLSRKFSRTLDLDTILKTTASLARKMLASEGSMVFMLEEGEPRLKAALGTIPFSDMRRIRPPTEQQWFKRVSSGANVIEEKVSLEWLPLPPESRYETHNLVAVPLLVGGDTVGYLMSFSKASLSFNESQLELLSTLGNQAAVALEKAKLYTGTLEEKKKIETILSALRDGLLVFDSNGILEEINPVAKRMLACEASPEGGKISDLLSDTVLETPLENYKIDEIVKIALGGDAVFGEMSLEGTEGVTVQAHYIPLRDPISSVTGVVLFLHDITELKRVDEMKSNFVSNVSHELRTPLTSITGFLSLLRAGRAGSLTAQQEEYLSVIEEQTETLTNLIEELLDLARFRASGWADKATPVDVAELISGAVKHFEKATRDKDVALNVHLTPGLPHVAADPARLTQVINNILDNAVKFTDAGGLIEVTALENGPNVQFQISDNGAGIAPSSLPHIFDRFFQAHATTSDGSGGFGLGLAICREIVEAYRGTIWVESELGRGTVFYFTVPTYREEEPGTGQAVDISS